MNLRLNLTSAGGLLALLDEPESQVQGFALEKLIDVVDVFWAEIADAINKIEVLYEDKTFPYNKRAALLTSKVYHHLGSFEDSLQFALGAEELFDIQDSSEYVATTIAKCIDFYIKKTNDSKLQDIDSRLVAIVDRMFDRCFAHGQYKQALGIALETRRLDVFKKSILESDDQPQMLTYALKVTMTLIQNRTFRNEVLRCLVELYMSLPASDYISVCKCLIFLDDPQGTAEILEKLLKRPETTLMAFQIGFDLYESATQQFLTSVRNSLKLVSSTTAAPVDSTADQEAESMDTDESTPTESTATASKEGTPNGTHDANGTGDLKKLAAILSGDTTISLHLQFLIRNNQTDLLILKKTKETVRNSICHTATLVANAFMHSGTTSDTFLRDNLEWLSRATNWAKFTATASLGVIHRGHEKDALKLMSTYLPKDTGNSGGSAYAEGGGLYALGLIHVNHGGEITEYLLGQIKDAGNEQVRHGGCLGLGLAAMGTARQDCYDQLKFCLYQDDAVTGEAAGLAMGLVMLGTKSAQAIEDMVAYAQDTQHEKILRGLALGIALTMYGRLEEADALIDSLSRDKDPILRRSGMYTIALAYAGTGHNKAIQRLLHVAVSDVNDDVRRAAVEALGFILFHNPEQCPSVVSLLSESYNPHVRYGAAMALGISCAGTGLKDAINILEPLTTDPVNYVRQGALLASALVLVNSTDGLNPKVKTFRELYAKVIADKHEDVMAKYGAIVAQGIIDAGGRNVTISLQSRTGHAHMQSIVGMLVFTQFWFWFPYAHFLSLAFQPSAIIGLNKDLKMPKMCFLSNGRPSLYAYPPKMEEKKDLSKEKVATAVLSITEKAKKKKEEREKKGKEEKMEVDGEKKPEVKEGETATTAPAVTKAATEKAEEKKPDEKKLEEKKPEEKKPEEKKEEEKKEEKKKEPLFEFLSNPARVLPQQLKGLTMPTEVPPAPVADVEMADADKEASTAAADIETMVSNSKRYSPLKDLSIGGIILMSDKSPDVKEEFVELMSAGGPGTETQEDGDEPEAPEAFEWQDDMLDD